MNQNTISPIKLLSVIFTGLLAVSGSALLIRLCQAPSLSIAFYRILIASTILLFMNAGSNRRVWLDLHAHEWRIGLLSGFFLAVHFAAWVSSLKFTTVTNSIVLVSTAPFFVALGNWIFFSRRPALMLAGGLALAFIGSLLMTQQQNVSLHPDSLTGDMLALFGAIAAAGYMLCGRILRERLNTLTYVTLAYSFSAVFLLIFAVALSAPLSGFSSRTWLLFLLIALFPQLIGHTAFNWTLKYLSAPVVATILLGEPVLAGLLAFFFLHEIPGPAQISGAVLILTGVIIAIWSEAQQDTPQPRTDDDISRVSAQ